MKVMRTQIFLGVISVRDARDPMSRLAVVRGAGAIMNALQSTNTISRVVVFSIGETPRKESRPEGGNPPHEVTPSHDLSRQVASFFPVHTEAHIVRDIDGAVGYAKAQSADGLIFWDTIDELTVTALDECITRLLSNEEKFAVESIGLTQSAVA